MDNYFNNLMSIFNSMTPAELAEHDADVKRRVAEQQEHEKAEQFRKSGVPERYLDESFATYEVASGVQKSAAKAATGFAQEVKCGAFKTLVMIGSAGVGKTHLACSIIREVGGKYRTAPEIVEEMRLAKSFNSKITEADIIDGYAHTRLLVIDEIGRGIAAPEEKYMLYQLINARYNTRKATVLISNHKKSDFLQYIGVAAADRLTESAVICELDGESYRRQLRGNK